MPTYSTEEYSGDHPCHLVELGRSHTEYCLQYAGKLYDNTQVILRYTRHY